MFYSILGQTVVPPTVDIAAATATLNTLGLLPIIAVVAVLGLATILYKRFRK